MTRGLHWTAEQLADYQARFRKGPACSENGILGVTNEQIAKPAEPLTNEERLAQQMTEVGLIFERQFYWMPGRKFQADFAFPDCSRLLIELDGGAHALKAMLLKDILKSQLMLVNGWRLLRIASGQVRKGTAVAVIQKALKA